MLLDKMFIERQVGEITPLLLSQLKVVRDANGKTRVIAPAMIDTEHLRVDADQLALAVDAIRPNE